jgi:hypothetical protein
VDDDRIAGGLIAQFRSPSIARRRFDADAISRNLHARAAWSGWS